jgi:hypothetical protein
VLCAGIANPAGDGARQGGDTATDQAGQGTRGKVNKLSGFIEQSMITSGGSFRRTLLSAKPAQRSCRTGSPVYIGWNRVHPMYTVKKCYRFSRLQPEC